MDILVNVANQTIKLVTNLHSLVEGTQKFVRFVFDLSEEWDDLLVFAQFTQNGTSYNSYLDDNNCVYLPPEITAGECTLMIYGSGETVIGTTNYLTLEINESILVSDAHSTEITESLYNQLVDYVEELDDRIDHIILEAGITEINEGDGIDVSSDGTERTVAIDPTIYSKITNAASKSYVDNEVGAKQDTLVSGTNIKTVNNNSLLGSGNVDIVAGVSDVEVDGVSVVTQGVASVDLSGKQDTLVSGTNIKTVNNTSLLGSGNLNIETEIVEGYYYNGSFYENPPVYTTDDQPAVLKAVTQANTLITENHLEDPAIFPDLIDLGLLDVTGALARKQVIGISTTNNSYDSLTPLTSDKVDTYDTTYTYDYSHYPTIIRTPEEEIIGTVGKIYIDIPTGAIYRYDGSSFIKITLANLVDGSSTGSVRGIGSYRDNSSYTIGQYALAEGCETKASGYSSHAEGFYTEASGDFSHAEYETISSGRYQTTLGKYNIEDPTAYKKTTDQSIQPGKTYYILSNGKYSRVSSPVVEDIGNYYEYTPSNSEQALIIGNGTYSSRSNALTVDWSGNVDVASGAKYKINGNDIFGIIYPIGSYYETSDSQFDPEDVFGGTWESETVSNERVVEEGTSGMWTYRKWSSGIAECWGRTTFTANTLSAWGNLYEGKDPVQYTYPADLFTSEPTISVTPDGSTSSIGSAGVEVFTGGTNVKTPSIYVLRPNAGSAGSQFYIHINARGVWKTYSAPTTLYRWHRIAST